MGRVLMDRLRRAVVERNLQLHYQPKFHLASMEMRGVEALLRWRLPEGDWVSPSIFVPMLEKAGLIGEVGAWLFERAAADAAWWRQQGLDIGRIAINVSPLQLQSDEFLPWMLNRCDAWNAQGTMFDAELTESTLLSNPGRIVDAMEALVGANVRFALDDFGMGYSSLDLLMRLPVSYLKIDRSFVAGMLTCTKADLLVEAIVRMGHEVGVEVIAEGIETSDQLQRLWELGCDIGQGYHFSPARAREPLLEWLRTRPASSTPWRGNPLGDTSTSGWHRQAAAAMAAAAYDIT